VTGDIRGNDTFGRQDRMRGDRDGEQRRLLILSELELIVGTLEA